MNVIAINILLFLCSLSFKHLVSALNLTAAPASISSHLTGFGYLYLGVKLSAGGDINGDGIRDILVGSYADEVFVVFGSTSHFEASVNSLMSLMPIAIHGTASDLGWTTMSNSGDCNGDGIADIVLGSGQASGSVGAVYVLFGSPGLVFGDIYLSSLTPGQGIIIQGENQYDYLGYAVNSDGDCNGDGLADIIMTAPGYSPYGLVYVIYGSNSLSSFTLSNLNVATGIRITLGDYATPEKVTMGADVNQDGFHDLLIAYPTADDNAGRVYLVYGSASLTNINLATVTSSSIAVLFQPGPASSFALGDQICFAGDMNGDGFPEIIIADGGGFSKIYIIYGSNSIVNIPDVNNLSPSQGAVLTLSPGTQPFVLSLSAGADFNGDGRADLLIGAYGSYYNDFAAVIYGSSSMNNIFYDSPQPSQGMLFQGPVGSYIGQDVVNMGDVNGDSVPDLLIGAPENDGGFYLVKGQESVLPTTMAPTQVPTKTPSMVPTFIPTKTPSMLPTASPTTVPTKSPTAGPTQSPTKQPTIIPTVGPTVTPSRVPTACPTRSPTNQPTQIPSGQAPGIPTIAPSRVSALDLTTAPASISSHLTGFGYLYLGVKLSAGGDINGDGIRDILVGSYADEVFVVFGSTSHFEASVNSLMSLMPIAIHGTASDLGWTTMSNSGDCNGDGIADIVLGSGQASGSVGAVYVLFGSPGLVFGDIYLSSLTPGQGIIIQGENQYDYLGYAVNSDGDCNGDGLADIIMTAPGYSPYGLVYVIYGSNSLSSFTLSNLNVATGIRITLGDYATPEKVTMGADVNQDGFHDLLIAYPTADDNAGRVYLVYGSASLTNINLATVTSSSIAVLFQPGPASSFALGDQICFAGDMNGDGFPEIIIADGGGFSKIYIIYGSNSIVNIPDVNNLSPSQGAVLTLSPGTQPFVLSLSAGADFNGDGRADLLIGAYGSYYNDFAAVIYGSSSMNNIFYDSPQPSQGMLFQGPVGSYIGQDVVNMGDVNGDSVPDLLIGAPENDGGFYLVKGQGLMLPIEQPIEEPVQQPIEFPIFPVFPMPVEQPVEEPVQQPIEFPIFPVFPMPVEQPVEEPVQQPIVFPIFPVFPMPVQQPQGPTATPTGEPSESPLAVVTSPPTNPFLPISLKPGLVAFYTFDGNVRDRSGNENNGNIIGGVTLSADRFGVANNAYEFDGFSGYMVMPGELFNFQNSLTVAFWVKPASIQNPWAALIDKTHFSSISGILSSWVIEQWENELNRIFFQYVHEPLVVPIPDPIHRSQLIANVWNHVAVTKDGTSLLFYLNSELVDTQTTTDPVIATNGNLPLLIGACNQGYTSPPSQVGAFFKGAFDEIGFWDRALTATEVVLLMTNGAPTAAPTTVPSAVPITIPTITPTLSPSAVPTWMPTFIPTCEPTGVPTQIPSQEGTLLLVPTIIKIDVFASAQSTILQCTFDHLSFFGGTVYCGAYDGSNENVATVPTANQLLSAGYQATFSSVQSVVNVTIINLIPAATYDSYCSVALSNGVRSSQIDISNTKSIWSTDCCKIISFSHVPRILNSNSEVYESVFSNPADYTIIYTLSTSPNRDITVQPVLLPKYQSSSSSPKIEFTFSPSVAVFTKVSVLQGQFVIRPQNSAFSGDFILSLKVSGASMSEFRAEDTTITFASIPAAPKLSEVVVGDSGVNMFIKFDSSTDLNGKNFAKSFLCNEIFNFTGAQLTSCTWLNMTTVKATFPVNVMTLAKPKETLQLYGNKIKPACSSIATGDCSSFKYSSAQSIPISAPYHAIIPAIVLNAPKVVGSCVTNVTIDTTATTGLGSRVVTAFQWNVFQVAEATTSSTSRLSSLNKLLNSFSNPIRKFTFPKDYLGVGTYAISLQITNWLGSSVSTTSIIKVVEDAYTPQLSLVGVFPMAVYAYQPIKISSGVVLPSCLPPSFVIRYQWTLLPDSTGIKVFNISSQTVNSAIYTLPAYALTAGETYSINLGVSVIVNNQSLSSTSVKESITVKSGLVHAIIKGGSSRQIPASINLNIDGSGSYDDNYGNQQSNLVYQWGCLVTSFLEFGTNCKNIFDPVPGLKSILVYGSRLQQNSTYSISLRVLSSDLTRASIQTIQLQQSLPFTALTDVESPTSLFNSNSNFTLTGFVQANTSQQVVWEAFVDGQNSTFDAYSPLSLMLKESYVSGTFIYSLVVAANAFPAGSRVTFRLTSTTVFSSSESSGSSGSSGNQRRLQTNSGDSGSKYSSYSTINLKGNGPPVNGQVNVDPTTGTGLDTNFNIQALYWEDDADDYPLTYSFAYLIQPDNPPLTIVDQGPLSSITTTFPPGLYSLRNQIILQVVVTDIHSGKAVLKTNITVLNDPNVDVSNYLNSNLANAFASKDSNLVFSTVNNVATTINQVDCSLLPEHYCASLNRKTCYSTPQTCDSCLPNFKGIVGPSNSLCFPKNSSQGTPGSSCLTGMDCLYGICTNSVCVTPTMECPSSSLTEPCSGHGVCQYFNLAGQESPEPCLITNVYCKASCLCDSAFGGRDCSLTTEKMVKRDINRGTLCDAIIQVNSFADSSSSVLGSMINSLLVSYSPDEVTSDQSVATCSNTLTTISSLTQDYLIGVDDVGQASLINTVSNYVIPSPDGKTAYLDSVISQVTSGLFDTVRNGELPKQITSPNIQISVQKVFAADLENATFTAPITEEGLAYGVEVPSFQVIGNSLEGCVSQGGYSQISIMQWGSNPFPNSSSIHSPMLRFSGVFNPNTVAPVDSSYFVTLPFTQTQNFNLSVPVSAINAHQVHNMTFPNCTVFEDGRYVSCGNCEIATYTNQNVTFSCKGIQNLCKPPKSGETSRRRLAGDDDYFSDDSTSLGSGMTASQYGALLEAVGESFVSTLSTNPFNVNIEEAKVVVSLVGSLIVAFLIGSIFFISWDAFDRIQFIYGEVSSAATLKTWFSSVSVVPKKLTRKNKRKLKQKSDRRNLSLILQDLSSTGGSTKTTNVIKEEPTSMEAVLRFFDLVIPTIFHEDPKKGWWKILKAILVRHDYTSVFFHPSFEKNRFMRWMDLYNAILNGLFISTLFYGTFYANTGQCEGYQTEEECIVPPNKITGESQCSWDKESQTCALNEPPADFSFTIILALTCTLIGVPLQLSITFILDEYCNKRPRLEDIGLSTEDWMGIGVRTVAEEIQFEKEELKEQKISGLKTNLELQGMEKKNVDSPSRRSLGENSASNYLNTSYPIHRAYDNLLTVEEEIERIFWLVHNYYSSQQTVQYQTFAANLSTTQSLIWKEINDAKVHEIIRHLGIQSNGKFAPLPFYEYLLYSSRSAKAVHKLEKTRNKSEELIAQLEELAEINQSSLQDVLMLHSFILEQFPAFKRWILKDQLLCFEGFFPSVIGFYPWFFAWTFVLAVYLFYCYWIFTWGIANGNLLLKQWGLNFAIGAIQDILFIQIAKILILYFIALFSIKPQLVEIKQLLVTTVTRMIQNQESGTTVGKDPKKKASPSDTYSLRKFFQFKLFQSSDWISATASALTPSIFDQNFAVVQFMSPTCRVAWQNTYKDLFLSKILQQLDDYDAMVLRTQFFSLTQRTVLYYLIIFVPLVMIFFGAAMAEMLLDVVIPVLASGIIVSNYYLTTLSASYVIIIWIGGFGLLFFYFYIWKKSFRYAIAQKNKRSLLSGAEKFTNMIQLRKQSSAQSKSLTIPQKKQRFQSIILKALQWVLSRNTMYGIYVLLGRMNWINYYLFNRERKRKEKENVWKNMNLPLIFQGKKIMIDQTDLGSVPKIYGNLLSIDYHSRSFDRQLGIKNNTNNKNNDREILLSRDFSRSYDSGSGRSGTNSDSRSSSLSISPHSRRSSPPPAHLLRRSRSYSNSNYPELMFSLDESIRNTFGVGLADPRKSEYDTLFELKDYIQSLAISNDYDDDENQRRVRRVLSHSASRDGGLILEYSDFDRNTGNSQFMNVQAVPPQILSLQAGRKKEMEKKNKDGGDNDEEEEEEEENQFEEENENYFGNEDANRFQHYLASTLLNVPKSSGEMVPFIVKLIESERKKKKERKALLEMEATNKDKYEIETMEENEEEEAKGWKSPKEKEKAKEVNFLPQSLKSKKGKSLKGLSLAEKFISKHYSFSSIASFLFNFLFLLLEKEYLEKKVEISKEMMEEMVFMIGIQYHYQWIVSKEALMEIFTKLPRNYQDNSQSVDVDSDHEHSIWDHYRPNKIALSKEVIHAIINDFSDWIKQERFSSSSSSAAIPGTELKEDYFSFHLFKEWFDKEIPMILKMISVHHSQQNGSLPSAQQRVY
jgi:hypothetical protein